MAGERVQRRLAAILAADVAGYARLMGADEAGTRARFNAHLRDLIEPRIGALDGRIVKAMGDGLLVEFASVVDALQCALDVQAGMAERGADEPEAQRMAFRIGVSLGDVIVEGDDIHGDGVNIAARLERLAEPGGICISSDVYRQVRGRVAARFEDLGEQSMKNIAEPLAVYRVRRSADTATDGVVAPTDVAAFLKRPALAVLPFANLSGDSEQDYFADGLAEDIGTALSGWRLFPVIAHSSASTYKGVAKDARQIAAELGARYIVQGSVRKGAQAARISTHLVDAATGHQLWAEKFDRRLDDIFAVQDEISQRVAATVESQVELAESKRLAAARAPSLAAWDCYLRGMHRLHENTAEANARARVWFAKALAIDPSYGRAHAGLAYSHHRDIVSGFGDAAGDSLSGLLDSAKRAVARDPLDSFCHVVLGLGHLWSGQVELAIAANREALALNPSDFVARVNLGNALDFAGRAEEGIGHIEAGLRLNPVDPRSFIYVTLLARAFFGARRYEAAAEQAKAAVNRRPDYADAHFVLAASLAQLGRAEAARAAYAECERLRPGYAENRARALPYQDRADSERFFEGLRRLGLPG